MKVLTIMHLSQQNYTVNIKEIEAHLLNENFPTHIADHTSRDRHNVFLLI